MFMSKVSSNHLHLFKIKNKKSHIKLFPFQLVPLPWNNSSTKEIAVAVTPNVFVHVSSQKQKTKFMILLLTEGHGHNSTNHCKGHAEINDVYQCEHNLLIG